MVQSEAGPRKCQNVSAMVEVQAGQPRLHLGKRVEHSRWNTKGLQLSADVDFHLLFLLVLTLSILSISPLWSRTGL